MNPAPASQEFSLQTALAGLLVAPNTLLADSAVEPALEASGAEALFVQGRGDRLHGVLAFQHARQLPPAPLRDLAVNWLWIVADGDEAASGSVHTLADALHAGVLRRSGSSLQRERPAPPRPGIFISRWPQLRARWRTISDW